MRMIPLATPSQKIDPKAEDKLTVKYLYLNFTNKNLAAKAPIKGPVATPINIADVNFP